MLQVSFTRNVKTSDLTYDVKPKHKDTLMIFFKIWFQLLFLHAKSINVNPSAQVHLPSSHIPELPLPMHWKGKLQNPPAGTVSEIINHKLYIQNG